MPEQAPRTEATRPYTKELAAGVVLGAVGAAAALGIKYAAERLRYSTVGSRRIPSGDLEVSLKDHVQALTSRARTALGGSPENGQLGLKERVREFGKNTLAALASSTEQAILLADTAPTPKSTP